MPRQVEQNPSLLDHHLGSNCIACHQDFHSSTKCRTPCSNTFSLGPRPKPTPAWIAARDTGSDPRWGWFGSGAETTIPYAVTKEYEDKGCATVTRQSPTTAILNHHPHYIRILLLYPSHNNRPARWNSRGQSQATQTVMIQGRRNDFYIYFQYCQN